MSLYAISLKDVHTGSEVLKDKSALLSQCDFILIKLYSIAVLFVNKKIKYTGTVPVCSSPCVLPSPVSSQSISLSYTALAPPINFALVRAAFTCAQPI